MIVLWPQKVTKHTNLQAHKQRKRERDGTQGRETEYVKPDSFKHG